MPNRAHDAAVSSRDLDASCVLLADTDRDGDLDPIGCVYFGAKVGPGIQHMGDNRTGEGAGDDETILLDLQGVDGKVEAIALTVSIFRYSNRDVI